MRYAAAERKNPCGTRAAYYRHLHHGETPDEACIQANRRYGEARRRAEGRRPNDEVLAERTRRAERNPHGTKPRYDLHISRGETPCDLCREGNNAYTRDRRHEQRRRQGVPEAGRRKPTYAEWLDSIGVTERREAA